MMMMFVSNILFWEFNEITPFFVEEYHQLFHVVRLIHKYSFCLSLKVNCEVLMALTRVIWQYV